MGAFRDTALALLLALLSPFDSDSIAARPNISPSAVALHSLSDDTLSFSQLAPLVLSLLLLATSAFRQILLLPAVLSFSTLRRCHATVSTLLPVRYMPFRLPVLLTPARAWPLC